MRRGPRRWIVSAAALGGLGVAVLVWRGGGEGEMWCRGPSCDELSVTQVVDGDTLEVAGGQRVRFIGIDTPERGECGYGEATRRVEDLVEGGDVQLLKPPDHGDRDRYGRILRYVIADGRDVGKILLEEGLAHARYDGVDGFDVHPRQDEYRQIDADTTNPCDTGTATSSGRPVLRAVGVGLVVVFGVAGLAIGWRKRRRRSGF